MTSPLRWFSMDGFLLLVIVTGSASLACAALGTSILLTSVLVWFAAQPVLLVRCRDLRAMGAPITPFLAANELLAVGLAAVAAVLAASA